MSFIITLLAAVFVFSAVIAIHEFGHFAVAKLCGVQVNKLPSPDWVPNQM